MSSVIEYFSKHWLHVIIWIMACIYLFFSPNYYYHFFVQEGKPVDVMKQPLNHTGKITSNIEVIKYRYSEFLFFNEEIYELRGWAFINLGEETNQTDFDRFIVLTSQNSSLLFSVETRLRTGVQAVFIELGLDLNQSGFIADISKNAIPPNLYCIGILFRHSQTGDVYFVNTLRGLVRTPNQVWLEEERLEECR